MTTALDAVLEKVRRLRALATSTNVHEAAAAAAAADRLIQEHGLSEAQLEADGHGGEKATHAEDALFTYAKGVTWKCSLAIRLARHFDCAIYTERSMGQQCDRLIGRPSDVQTVRYFFAWLTVEIERLAQATKRVDGPSFIRGAKGFAVPRGVRWLNSFRNGAVEGVMSAMEESKQAARESAQAAGATTALAIVDSRAGAADELLRALFPKLRSIPVRSKLDPRGFDEGERAGRAINRSAHLTGAPARALPGARS